MPVVKLQIDVSDTVGDEVWRNLRHFDLAESSFMDSQPEAAHLGDECVGAAIHVETMLLAQYAVAHYLEQDRVLDADVEPD